MGIRVMDSNDQERERGITILAKVGFASSILICDTHHGCVMRIRFVSYVSHAFRPWFHLCRCSGIIEAMLLFVGIQYVFVYGMLPAGAFGFALEGFQLKRFGTRPRINLPVGDVIFFFCHSSDSRGDMVRFT